MDENIKRIGYGALGRLIDFATIRLTSSPKTHTEQRIERIDKTLQSLPASSEEPTQTPTTAPEMANKAPDLANPTPTTNREEGSPTYERPTKDETTKELKRRLVKELYRLELDLSSKLRIGGKACDCFSDKHALMIEAAAEEVIAKEPENTVYSDIIDWLRENQYKGEPEAIISGNYDREYLPMAAELSSFRKRVTGTGARAIIETKEQISLEEAKKMAAEEAAKKVEERWG